MNSPAVTTGPRRIEGLDVARAAAILGMVVVHFLLVMTDGQTPAGWCEVLLDVLDGRAAATFVVLAGMGVALMAAKAGACVGAGGRETVATVLRRRGWLLLGLGFLNLTIWPGDILRVYGVSLLLAPWLIWRGARTLLLSAAGFVLVFGALFLALDYGRNWDWTAMKYRDLWTASGLWRNLFFDGFRSVFPWTGLLLVGVWLGRFDWSTTTAGRRAVASGVALLAGSALVSRGLVGWAGLYARPGFTHEDAVACFGLRSMPPMPLFLLNAAGFALVVIGTGVLVTGRWRGRWVVRALGATGRLAFTWYVAHIVLGLGGIILLGWTGTSSLRALLTALGFFAAAVAVSFWWNRNLARGPMESLLRRVGDGKARATGRAKS